MRLKGNECNFSVFLNLEDNFLSMASKNDVLLELQRLKSLEVVYTFIFRKQGCISSYVSKVTTCHVT